MVVLSERMILNKDAMLSKDIVLIYHRKVNTRVDI